MNKNIRKKLIFVAVIAVGASVAFSGCQRNSSKKATESSPSEIKYNGDSVYPVQCDDELTYWKGLDSSVSKKYSNFGDTEIAEYISEQTGVKVKYIHPAAGMEEEQFNLLLASKDLPDIMVHDWLSYGVQKAIEENYIFELTDVIKDQAPNLSKLLSENEEYDKLVKTDDGKYYAFPFLRGDPYLCVYIGPIVRRDWLDDLGLDIPETIDDWDVMLQAFKDKKGAAAPLAFNTVFLESGPFCGAYGVTKDYYLNNEGNVTYGPAEPGFKNFLQKMNDWYNRGLLDTNFAVSDSQIIDGYMLNNKSGASVGYAGGNIGSWLDGKKEKNFDLVGAPYPVMKKGDRPMFGSREWEYIPGASVSISATCKNKELAVRFLDWGYSEAGKLAYNYGIEGKSYEIIDGKPKFTSYVTNNSEGNTLNDMIALWGLSSNNAPTVQERTVVDTQRKYQQQRDAVEKWQDTDMVKHKLPLISLTSEETSAIAGKKTDIDTYMQEKMFGFISGSESLDSFDDYVKQLYDLGLQDVLDTMQKAVERYNKR